MRVFGQDTVSKRAFEFPWQICRDGQSTWRPVAVPGCWEDAGWPAADPGPYWYRTTVHIPKSAAGAGQRIWLKFGAVSYACTVSVDGQELHRHIGMWDPFEVEITGAVTPGKRSELLVQVEKPAGLTAGPDSPAVPGRFPLRQTLSGFLPYVWGHAFGGIWQPVALAVTGPRRLDKIHARGTADGHLTLTADLSSVTSGDPAAASGPVVVTIHNPAGRLLIRETIEAGSQLSWSGHLPNPQPWSPTSPALYTARLSLPEDRRGGTRTHPPYQVRFGLRTLETRGASLLLNGQPLYPRLVLSWGWYPNSGRRCPDPGPDRVRADLLRLQGMGYNGVKLCLWFPPPYYFELADELGMLLWVELPMWLPEPTPFFRQQVPIEYDRLVRAARNHPSALIYSLGCELDRKADALLLDSLYAQAKSLAGDALVCDNSGSGEAYGGSQAAATDFYDNHFYCDLQFLRPLIDAFTPAWRAEKPWLMGEFCDYDTFRDWPAILQAHDGAAPWWLSPDSKINPQGARWEYRMAGQIDRVLGSGLLDRSPELIQASHRQGLLHRKVTLEAVRTRPELSGYVVTGETNTPISTAGMWDDLGRAKFEIEAFREFNQDLVLLLGWDRLRAWVAGGDRPAFQDPYSYRAEALVRAHLVASYYSSLAGPARLTWQVAFPGEAPFATGHTAVELIPGRIQELAVAEFHAPPVTMPRRATLQAQLQAGDFEASEAGQAEPRSANRWPLWIYPANPWAGLAPFGLIDPPGVLSDLPALVPDLCQALHPGSDHRILVCTAWGPAVETLVSAGGRAILFQQKNGPPGPLPTVDCPYWREALKLVKPHPAWGDFPHASDPGLQFYGLATDCALDIRPTGQAFPLLRRLDTRSLDWHEYAVVLNWGQGQAIVTTLRPQGGLGDQPTGLGRNPAAVHLLTCWLRYLAGHKACKDPEPGVRAG